MKRARAAAVLTLIGGLIVGAAAPASASFPEQRRVAFVRYDGADFRVIRMRPNGLDERKVVRASGGIGYYAATMSPDGRRVVISVGDGSQFDLFVKRLGGKTKQITDTPARSEFSPVWSPDGRSIVFMETDSTTYSAIVRRNRDGTGRREIDRNVDGFLLFPSVSPDGKRVLFSAPHASAPTRGPAADYDLVTKKLDGTGRRWLTSDDSQNQIAGDWSPDGDRVAFLIEALLKPGPIGSVAPAVAAPVFRGALPLQPVYSMRSDGGGRRLITEKRGIVGRVLYTPDGERVMVSRFTSDSLDLYSTPVRGGVLKRLTETFETYNLFDLFDVLSG
ncbi:MAG: hypothetical protein OEV60_02085 [Actinomycetota bacterium]|nr:hypothetical protein [Actinomycetota bacterium]MDH5224254.1 hypothetical protein [Actinomycetota bacterium]